MIGYILNKIIGTQNERMLKKIIPLVPEINALEPEISRLSDAELRAKTDSFKKSVKEKSEAHKDEFEELENKRQDATSDEEKDAIRLKIKLLQNEILDQFLYEAFACVREASRRTIGLRHFDMQLVGGIVLHQGRIAEMATGEGKTLVATAPVYLNALTGRGVHVVTVNDYLARRDCGWMGPVYYALGVSCAAIAHDLSVLYDPNYTDEKATDERLRHLRPITRQQAYGADVTYGTNNEFGFDYLRDNMAVRLDDIVQREPNYAIVDEVDSILIDESRTPLIISGPAEESTDKYYKAQGIAGSLAGRRVTEKELIDAKYRGEDITKGYDYLADEKANTISLTENGEINAARMLGVSNLHEIETMEERHHITQALRAKEFFKRDVDYVVKDNEVIIVDEFTGRLMPGRRWSDGLHQAIEAKEGARIERENQTLATITFQNYFRMYRKLAGMTGTAVTEAQEFDKIYRLGVVVIPTNKPLIRVNSPDVIYKTEREKFNAVVEEIAGLYKKGQPILVGTISIDRSEHLSQLLKRRGVPHNVLNAKYHEQEATIIAQAGRLKQITIATNMAGRGTDILLGGNPDFLAREILIRRGAEPSEVSGDEREGALKEAKRLCEEEHNKVVQLGGLHILGTERHEARRIDNQLRGRSGRQGDPGSSRFYLALEDDLMRIFGSDRIKFIMDKLGMEEGQDITHPLVSRSIEVAQKRVETHNFEIRKHLLEYDNVMNKQREVIYAERRLVLEGKDLKERIFQIIDELILDAADLYLNKDAHREEWNIQELREAMRSKFAIELQDIDFVPPPFHSGGIPPHKQNSVGGNKHSRDEIIDEILKRVKDAYIEKERSVGEDVMMQLARAIMLQIIDTKWKDHLYNMDSLREGIGLRAYGQSDPLVEYKREGYDMFADMVARIKEEAVEFLFRVEARPATERPMPRRSLLQSATSFLHPDAARPIVSPQSTVRSPQLKERFIPEEEFAESKPAPLARTSAKVGRNDPCPCGSGRKYKKCCGK